MGTKITQLRDEFESAERAVVNADMIDSFDRRRRETDTAERRLANAKEALTNAVAGRLIHKADDIAALIGTQPGLERVYLDEQLGLLSIEHDGSIGWDQLQAVKELVWGPHVAAIEVYPPRDRVVNNIEMRHLWRLGADDWWPDLGREGLAEPACLRDRYLAAQITGPDAPDPFNGFGSGPTPIEPR